jgi:TPR repeat protein
MQHKKLNEKTFSIRAQDMPVQPSAEEISSLLNEALLGNMISFKKIMILLGPDANHLRGSLGAIEAALNEGSPHSNALALRAFIHRSGQGGAVNDEEAIRLYEQAIALGNDFAMNNRAYMHQHGQGGAVNYREAIRLYEQAIALGNDVAMANRAFMHQHGQGGAVNYREAIRLYERAITLGNDAAMANRASMHQHGQGGAVNYKEARLYELSYEKGQTSALAKIKEMADQSQDDEYKFLAQLSLCKFFLQKQQTSKALVWYKKNPERILEALLEHVIIALNKKDPSSILCDFILRQPTVPGSAMDVKKKFIQAKIALLENSDEDTALEIFENQLPRSFMLSLSAQDIFMFASAQLARPANIQAALLQQEQDELLQQEHKTRTYHLLYSAYMQNRDKDLYALLIEHLRGDANKRQGNTCGYTRGHEKNSDAIKIKVQEEQLITDFLASHSLLLENNKPIQQQLLAYKKDRLLESQKGFRGFFERGKPLFAGADRMHAIDKIISRLESGKRLESIIEDPEIKKLVGNDRLNGLIKTLIKPNDEKVHLTVRVEHKK